MRYFIRYLFLLFSFSSASVAYAAPDFADMGSLEQGFLNFVTTLSAAVTSAISSAAVQSDVNLLWTFFALLLVIWTMFEYSFGKGTVVDLVTTALLIMIVKVLMASFDPLTSGIWSAANGFASDVQTGLLGTPDLFFAPAFISRAFASITFSDASAVDIIGGIAAAINLAIYSVVSMILSALAYFAVIWCFWGYSIAKLIGLLFIPFLMYERLSWLFDGWLRFFFGFVVYAIVARLNIALTALAIAAYFGIPVANTTLIPISQPPLTHLSQILSLLAFAFIGILATLSTGSFVAAIVGGSAQSSGVGRMASRGALKLAGKMFGK
jgi:hypothetical protein